MYCTDQREERKNAFSLKRIIVKFTVWKLPSARVMGLAHLSSTHRVSKASVVNLPVEWTGEGNSNPSDFTGK